MRKRLLKPVALVLAVSFLNTQVLWAASFEKSIVESLIKYWAQGRSVSTLEKN
ncbi:MAG: hypothetical protein HYT89_05245, partial [Candidatus Omnitrophica bacterium]|nr:hypothetical protein [Candidatus Omnitrophota bacterium]